MFAKFKKLSKILTIILLLLLAIHHFISTLHRFQSAKDSCNALLTTGHLTKSLQWKPDTCSLHYYTHDDAFLCMQTRHNMTLRRNYLAFVGDSRVRDFYYAFVDVFDFEQYRSLGILGDMSFLDPGAQLEIRFLWRSYLLDAPTMHFGAITPDDRGPDLLMQSAGTWYWMIFWEMPGTQYSAYRRHLKANFDKVNAEIPATDYVWKFQVQTSYQNKPPWTHANITDDRLEAFNAISEDVVRAGNYENIWIWSSHRLVNEGLKQSNKRVFRDYLHPGRLQYEFETQILINFYCNRVMDYADGSCCRKLKLHELPGFFLSSFFHCWFSVLTICWTVLWLTYEIVLEKYGNRQWWNVKTIASPETI